MRMCILVHAYASTLSDHVVRLLFRSRTVPAEPEVLLRNFPTVSAS